MKWFLLFIIFVGGVWYLMNKKPPTPIKNDQPELETTVQKNIAPPPPPPPPPPLPIEQRVDPQTLAQMRALTKDSDANVRLTAMQTLVRLEDPTIVKVMDNAIDHDDSPTVQTQLVILMAQLQKKDPNVLAYLVKYANGNANRDVRLTSINALGESINPQALPVLTRLMKDYDSDVKQRSIGAVERLQADLEKKRKEEEEKRRKEEEERKRREEEQRRLEEQQKASH